VIPAHVCSACGAAVTLATSPIASRASRMTARQLVLTVVAIAASSACGGRALNPGPTSGAAGNGGGGHEGGTAGTAGTSGSVGAGGSVGTGGSGIAAGGTGGAGGITSTGAAGTCGVERLTAAEATSLYRKYAFEVQPGPGLNPTVIFEGVPLDVPGLWEGLNAQLFLVKGFSQDGSPWRDCTIMTSACRVFIPSAECGLAVRPLSSGLVANGAFYFAWSSGSGVFRSRLGKLARATACPSDLGFRHPRLPSARHGIQPVVQRRTDWKAQGPRRLVDHRG
jgi:hypothetical protein